MFVIVQLYPAGQRHAEGEGAELSRPTFAEAVGNSLACRKKLA